MTRDGIERTDILAVLTTDAGRRTVEIQVKATRGPNFDRMSWRLGLKAQDPVSAEHEFFVLVAIPEDVNLAPRCFVVPRIHVSAAAWIGHQHWLHDTTVLPGKRNTGIEQARQGVSTFHQYENKWDLLERNQSEAPILLPADFRVWAEDPSVGLIPGHPWENHLPTWPTEDADHAG